MQLSKEEFEKLARMGDIGEKAAIYITWLEAKLQRIRNNFHIEDGPQYPKPRPPAPPPVPRRSRKKQRR